ncbi:MAG: SCO family protein [Bdellovibrionales bacterium]|nr:SCO family protein [Bdellovibrionales bacterium]
MTAITPRKRNPFFWLTILGIIAILTVISFSRPKPVPPTPILATLEPFELKDQDSRPFGLAEMQGHVTVANFIFTSCADTCPLLTQQMAKIQRRAAEQKIPVQLLSVSVDPDTDTPAVLKAYAQKYGADLSNWHFVTGPLKAIEKVVMAGFRVALDRPAAGGDLFDITHGEHFVVVDKSGRLRAYKKANNSQDISIILGIAQSLENEKVNSQAR